VTKSVIQSYSYSPLHSQEGHIAMPKLPQRTIEAASVASIGLVFAADLVAMHSNTWGFLRDRITDWHRGRDGLRATCLSCDGDVYIRTAHRRGKNLPLFQHYAASSVSCPWYSGRNQNVDDIRALQYSGKPEGTLHRTMCETIASLASKDRRCVDTKINEYRMPSEHEHGRFPDVWSTWRGIGEIVFEIQVSNTFETEIAARCKHYEYEGVQLIWILAGIDVTQSIPQNFLDVIRRHRGNAFVLDYSAIAASHERATLVLSCYLQNDLGFDPPKLVSVDDLIFPRSRLPFFEDRISAPMLAEFEAVRQPWLAALPGWDHYSILLGFERSQALLVAAIFSIVATAKGSERNFASNHPNVRGMLNTYLHGKNFAGYAKLLTQVLRCTSLSHYLEGKVGEHLRRFASSSQVDEDSAEWRLLRKLFPEILDPLVRSQLSFHDALPDWASANGVSPAS
jgi:hypothetical protein